MTSSKPLSELFRDKVARTKPHVIPFAFMVVVMLGLYFASIAIPPGPVTWVMSAVALLVIAVTALARLNDIIPEQCSKRWQIRRAGLILVGAASAGISVGDPIMLLFSNVPFTDFPSWKEVALRWGIALTWITTPHMPPWWRYITGEYKTVREAKRAAAAVDIAGLYPDGNSQTYLSPEMVKAVDAIKSLKGVIEALPDENGNSPASRLFDPGEVERRHGGDRREVGP